MTLSGGFDAYASYASSIDDHSLRRLRALRAEREVVGGGAAVSVGEHDRLVGPDARERAGLLRLAEQERGRALRVTARDERRVAARGRDGRRPRARRPRSRPTRTRRRRIGRVAVAVAAEVERPHAAPGGDEPLGDRRPDPAVEAGRVGEQRRRAVAAPVVHDELPGRPVDRVRAWLRHRRASSQSRYVRA